MSDSEQPMNPPDLYCDEQYEDEPDPNADEYERNEYHEEEPLPRTLKRAAAEKGPAAFSLTQLWGEDEPPEDEEVEPDLHLYFSQFPELGKANVIAICRSYANAVSATIPKAPRGPYKPRKQARFTE